MSTIILRMLAIGEADRCERLVLALSCRWQLVIGMAATPRLRHAGLILGFSKAFVIGPAPSMGQVPVMGHAVGVDVSLRSLSLESKSKEMASEFEAVAAAITGFAEHVDGVALETGNLTPRLAAWLRAEGFRVVVWKPAK